MEGRTHVPVVNPDICGLCGVCRGGCPAVKVPELAEDAGTMRATLAPASKQRAGAEAPPCSEACPLGQDISGYLSCLAAGDQAGALEIILRDNPLPSVLGHVCHHPCQSACLSAAVQEPPRVRDLKRYAAQAERPQPSLPTAAGPRVAIVGAGPAGLAAAWELARNGGRPVVFDSQPLAGGLLAWAIPDFRLPREALQRDLDYISAFGVEFKLGQAVSPDDLAAMQKDYDAVILACGAPLSRPAQLPGSEAEGVWPGLELLKRAALGPLPRIGHKVAVVGGGNVALDAARWCLRRGAEAILVYRRDREQMPAYAEEVEAALSEGLALRTRLAPLAVEVEGGKVAGLKVAATLPASPGPDGRVAFAVLEEQETLIECDTVVLALGQVSQAPEWAAALGLGGLSPEATGRLAPGVFVAGDLANGPATVVEAMAGGVAAAQAILEEVKS